MSQRNTKDETAGAARGVTEPAEKESNAPLDVRSDMDWLLLCARAMERVDVALLLRTFELADDFGCFMDPTLWIRNAKSRQQSIEFLRGAKAFQSAFKKIKEDLGG